MQHKFSETELKEIARQLSCPDGENGIKTGERMDTANGNMTHRAIETLSIASNQQILEIGPGNGSHLAQLLNKAHNLHYTGIDISKTMVDEASRINAEQIQTGTATFLLTDGLHLNFKEESFDRVFTVNTVYFWGNPTEYIAEIYRILKTDGLFNLAFVQQHSMEKLPFTQYGFQLYTIEKATNLLKSASFSIQNITNETEELINNMESKIERDFVIITARK
ncbi:class I SAM-dependent methyltransferase [Flavobacterium sp. '19STA2R22 D10 B1']|uniref:class I SAM-dependent methyltransferase n=1 Tax=Flavobacterium aerium TaxID=3037261 RepID=UPI00278C8C39|nr:class I SAM-dependent methyltransferase [Flavobacterium sp. '19STA2R22 D10 B1']